MAVSLLTPRVACWKARLPALLEQSETHKAETKMQAALMVPCWIGMFYPRVGIAALGLLERLGVDVVYPKEQTCCGQPMANSGCYEEARATDEHCARVFGSFDCVVTPSGSCTHHISNKFTAGPPRRLG
jgi:Fe-S oxidoreductase